MRLAENIRTYGVEAILGRVMYAREVLRCNAAMNVYNLKKTSMTIKDAAEWTSKNPRDAATLVEIEKLIDELEANA